MQAPRSGGLTPTAGRPQRLPGASAQRRPHAAALRYSTSSCGCQLATLPSLRGLPRGSDLFISFSSSPWRRCTQLGGEFAQGWRQYYLVGALDENLEHMQRAGHPNPAARRHESRFERCKLPIRLLGVQTDGSAQSGLLHAHLTDGLQHLGMRRRYRLDGRPHVRQSVPDAVCRCAVASCAPRGSARDHPAAAPRAVSSTRVSPCAPLQTC